MAIRSPIRRLALAGGVALWLALGPALAGGPGAGMGVGVGVAVAAAPLESRMPDVAGLGRTQTMRLVSEGALTLEETLARVSDMPGAAEQLAAWGWTDAYERTFESADALPNDASLVQVTYHRFSTPVTPEMAAWFAEARTVGTALAVQPPHAQHPDWVKLGGPVGGGNEVTYYAAAGNVLARVITVAAGDPTADATDIMGRALRLLGGGGRPAETGPRDDPETGDAGARPAAIAVPATATAPAPAARPAAAANPAATATTAPTAGAAPAEGADAGAEAFAALDAFWARLVSGAWYDTPGMETVVAPADSACGPIAEGQGPFYCPMDGTVYLNAPVVERLAESDVALGLILAHEWGHHLQKLAGFGESAFPAAEGDVYGTELELAADCFAGVWVAGEVAAGRATLDRFAAALASIAALGDAAGSPLTDPDARGSDEMRQEALALGATTGNPSSCVERYLS